MHLLTRVAYGNTQRVRAWLATHPRIQLHFTSTSASWLNLVEVFFSIDEILAKLNRQTLQQWAPGRLKAQVRS